MKVLGTRSGRFILTCVILIIIASAITYFVDQTRTLKTIDLAQTHIDEIYQATSMIGQAGEEYIDVRLDDLYERGFLAREDEAEMYWEFEFDVPKQKIIATSTEKLPEGAGKVIEFDIATERFYGYKQPYKMAMAE
ncbi:hypothetical protein K8I28_15165 [bacterium]|nr:hypothetical protein [bacterium]